MLFGEALGNVLCPGSVVLLYGELGSGKTVLVQGVARGLGTDEVPCSPTFVLLREHRYPVGACGTGKSCKSGLLLHADLYRLPAGAPPALGIADMLEEGAICCIEWADRLSNRPVGGIEVKLNRDYLETHSGENRRIIELQADPEIVDALVMHRFGEDTGHTLRGKLYRDDGNEA